MCIRDSVYDARGLESYFERVLGAGTSAATTGAADRGGEALGGTIGFPLLIDQFLADAVEDALEGVYKELPYSALAQALFALVYAHKKVGIIPDSILSLGYADNSSVVRAVLIQNEKAFAIYAGTQGVDWQKITSQP